MASGIAGYRVAPLQAPSIEDNNDAAPCTENGYKAHSGDEDAKENLPLWSIRWHGCLIDYIPEIFGSAENGFVLLHIMKTNISRNNASTVIFYVDTVIFIFGMWHVKLEVTEQYTAHVIRNIPSTSLHC